MQTDNPATKYRDNSTSGFIGFSLPLTWFPVMPSLIYSTQRMTPTHGYRDTQLVNMQGIRVCGALSWDNGRTSPTSKAQELSRKKEGVWIVRAKGSGHQYCPTCQARCTGELAALGLHAQDCVRSSWPKCQHRWGEQEDAKFLPQLRT